MKKKVLLMGKSGSGKTSMRSIIFANYIARDTRRLGATIDVEHSHVRFLGNLVLNLWDCGGQEAFMENYFASQRDHIFKNVEVLIYVFDVESPTFHTLDLNTFSTCVEAIQQNSPAAKVFCLIHKMDLVRDAAVSAGGLTGGERARVFEERKSVLENVCANTAINLKCFGTSIWDETLYKAWSQIVYSLIPNVKQLELTLSSFCEICEADEVILFERATFLVISHSSRKPHYDTHRFEKISNMIKQFKLSCGKVQAQFQGMEMRDTSFAAFIEGLTANTFVMVVVSDKSIEPAVIKLNIQLARRHFEKLEIAPR